MIEQPTIDLPSRQRYPAPSKALSLWQPYASLIAIGAILPEPVKPYETRSWPPPPWLIGQRIAIHAAQKIDRGYAEFCRETVAARPDVAAALRRAACGARAEFFALKSPADRAGDLIFGAPMPIGCVVATAKVAAAYRCGIQWEGEERIPVLEKRLSDPAYDCHSIATDAYGDYSFERWMWLLTEVEVLRPTKRIKGNRKVFNLPDDWQE